MADSWGFEHIKAEVEIFKNFFNETLSQTIKLLADEPSSLVLFFKNLCCGLNFRPAKVVYIEGNIGSGKTTFLKCLDFLVDGKVSIVPEPLDIWLSIKNLKSGVNALEAFYKAIDNGDKNFMLKFELLALYSRLMMLTLVFTVHPEANVFFSERSIFSDRYFNILISVLIFNIVLLHFFKKNFSTKPRAFVDAWAFRHLRSLLSNSSKEAC